jgi:hypothetical protein
LGSEPLIHLLLAQKDSNQGCQKQKKPDIKKATIQKPMAVSNRL